MTAQTREEIAALRVISLGAGVQSTALVFLALEGRIAADAAVFADTQQEPQAVYQHFAEVIAPACAAADFPLHIVTAGDLGEDAVAARTRIPAFTGTGMTPRQCSRDYKVRPIRGWLRSRVGPRGRAVSLLGISLDEVHRMRLSDVRWVQNEYPLVDLRWTRWDCQRYLAGLGISPPKSACVFCPYHSDSQWRSLGAEDFGVAARFEARLQAANSAGGRRALRGTPFLHRSLMPLRTVDLSTLEDHGQLALFGEECEGVCGV